MSSFSDIVAAVTWLKHQRAAVYCTADELVRKLNQIGLTTVSGKPWTKSSMYAAMNPQSGIDGMRLRRQRLCAARKIDTHARHEWETLKKSVDHRCLGCGERHPLTKDHIFPIFIGGDDGIGNIRPLCRSCNSAGGPAMHSRSTPPPVMTSERVKQIRSAAGENVAVFGARFHRSGRTVEDWEQGRRRPDHLAILMMNDLADRIVPTFPTSEGDRSATEGNQQLGSVEKNRKNSERKR